MSYFSTLMPGVSAEKAPNYYDVLRVTKSATGQQIKKAYRELSKKYHPDINKTSNAAQKFMEIAAAYEVLSDPDKKKQFDDLGPEGYQRAQQSGMPSARDDFWDIPFSFFGGGRRRGNAKAPSLNMKLYVTLEQLYFGDLLHVSYRRPVVCVHSDDCLTTRNDCQGEGVRVVQQQVGPGFIVQNQIPDDTCVDRRKGWKTKCAKCPKGPTDMEHTFLSAYVEKGMETGAKISFEGAGTQMLGHDAGDLVLHVVEQNHARFERNGVDLYMEMTITLLEALEGFEKNFTHLNGKLESVKQNEVTADGEVIILRGHGMPLLSKEEMFGDLFVTIRVQFPVSLDAVQKLNARDALKDVTTWKLTVKS